MELGVVQMIDPLLACLGALSWVSFTAKRGPSCVLPGGLCPSDPLLNSGADSPPAPACGPPSSELDYISLVPDCQRGHHQRLGGQELNRSLGDTIEATQYYPAESPPIAASDWGL